MDQTIVIFGASGDLTARKLIPALYELFRKRRLPECTRIVGLSRTAFSHDEWRHRLAETTREYTESTFSDEIWSAFAANIFYYCGDMTQTALYPALNQFLTDLELQRPAQRVFYLATAPRFYWPIIDNLGAAGMAEESAAPRRVVIEKPFGTDAHTANELNQKVHTVFQESQIYRIDHYLGKETVTNIMAFRFANTIFEPLWNRNYIDNIQITAAESGLVGRRAGYYETAGVLRDMFQNHLLQLLILTAMEAPPRFEADVVRDEKVKVLRSIIPMNQTEAAARTVRGQYRTYRDEEGVNPLSETATFGAVRLEIENWRWKGVPFYLRSGKAMSCQTTQIVVEFKKPPHFIFDPQGTQSVQSNRLVLQIQPAEGIRIDFLSKVPDQGMVMRQSEMNFSFQSKESNSKIPDSYQRLLLDVMQGDASLFARADEVELAWNIIDPIQQAWDAGGPDMDLYQPGLWGPVRASQWIESQGRLWYDCCPVIAPKINN